MLDDNYLPANCVPLCASLEYCQLYPLLGLGILEKHPPLFFQNLCTVYIIAKSFNAHCCSMDVKKL